MTIAYFCLASLDLMGALEESTSEEERSRWIDWVWDQQLRESAWSSLPALLPFHTS